MGLPSSFEARELESGLAAGRSHGAASKESTKRKGAWWRPSSYPAKHGGLGGWKWPDTASTHGPFNGSHQSRLGLPSPSDIWCRRTFRWDGRRLARLAGAGRNTLLGTHTQHSLVYTGEIGTLSADGSPGCLVSDRSICADYSGHHPEDHDLKSDPVAVVRRCSLNPPPFANLKL